MIVLYKNMKSDVDIFLSNNDASIGLNKIT
jgi:hypothetical protein